MSKPIRSYPKNMQGKVIQRRLGQKVQGLGYWSARDAAKHRQPKPKPKSAPTLVEKVVKKITGGG